MTLSMSKVISSHRFEGLVCYQVYISKPDNRQDVQIAFSTPVIILGCCVTLCL